ncbi:PQQ-dependent sugar dehydrogenase [Vibrio sp. PP-XX7]
MLYIWGSATVVLKVTRKECANVHNLLGSMLRIYPSRVTRRSYWVPQDNLYHFIPEAKPEILFYGVRNPWKLTFDSKGDVIIADVGEHKTEEVDVIPVDKIGTQVINLGWNIKEGKNASKVKIVHLQGYWTPSTSTIMPVLPGIQLPARHTLGRRKRILSVC